MDVKKKILFVIDSLKSGGAERVLSELSNHFVQTKQYEVNILLLKKEVFYPISQEIKITSLYEMSETINNKSMFSSLLYRLDKLKRLYKRVKAIQPDIIISFLTFPNMESTIIGKLLKIPVIISERSNPFKENIGKWTFFRRFIYPFSKVLVCQTVGVSSFYKPWIKNIAIIQNSTRRNLFTGFIKKEKIVLSVGRLSVEKGYDLLIKAFSKIDFKDWKLMIAGEGKNRKELELLIKNLKMEGKIVLLGRIKNIEDYYQKASVFVLPSRYEGFPNVLCEAMSFGLPSIAFDCDFGPRDIIQHNVDGILVEKENVDKLAKQLQILIDSPEKRELLGREAKKINNRLSIDKIANKWISLIEEILKEK